ncbi:MAG TPA: ATP-binding protein [Salegentibacter sp.]|uniref:tetratricopeptide repeat-containing hybrid sensor histidine kinase/response regulator n=1 Tax=Salegentibacter sp. TaxID=1903072 RepID=UPI002F920011
MNFTHIWVFFIIFSSTLPSQDVDEVEETNAEIQRLLSEAEKSINVLDFDKALQQLNTSLEFSKAINNKKYIALSSSILAKMYYIRHEYSRATTELNRAISIQREIEDEMGLAYSYITYAKILNSERDSNRAHKYLNLAESLSIKNNNTEYFGIILLNRGILNLNLDQNLSLALSNFNKAEEYLKNDETPDLYEISRLHFYRGRTHAALKNFNLALADLQAASDIGIDQNFTGMLMSTNKGLSEVHEEMGNPEKALEFLKISNMIRDSTYNMNKEAIAVDATTRYGVDAMKSSLNELALQNAEQERSLKVNKLTTILSVALITILSLLTLSLYKNNNLRARANELLQKKNTELTKAKENAEKASMAKAQFLSTITHELRTPLYAVTGLTHLLLEESPTENQKEHLNSLKFSGEYLLSLINNILDLNKLEANKVEIMEASFNLEKRISDVLIALKNSADDKHTKIHFNFDKEIPRKLKGDPLKISQILINLIGNSIKFTEDGDIWISVKKAKQDGPFIWLNFEIKDNGEGITKEKQKAIFENFTQGSTQINRKFGGTGLGLSIVKNLLHLLGSDINLESELGKGSCFTFELKFEAEEYQNNETSELPSTIDNTEVMKGKKILVVEDNKINQMITRKILEKNDIICDVADNGTDAIEKIKSEDFDLVLMDIHMPGISGIEATAEIRKFNSNIPIIALTAVTLDDNLDEFYGNGFSDIIPKPYKTEEFYRKINNHLALRESTV